MDEPSEKPTEGDANARASAHQNRIRYWPGMPTPQTELMNLVLLAPQVFFLIAMVLLAIYGCIASH
jgi:hypothetical protein